MFFSIHAAGPAGRRPRRRTATRLRPGLESLEGRAVMAGVAAPDLALVAASTLDSRGVIFGYNVTGDAVGQPVDVAIYRSAHPAVDATAVRIGDRVLSGAELDVGPHVVTTDLAGGLPIEPDRPYVLAVADPAGAVAAVDRAHDQVSFRIYVVGAIAHGLEPSGTVPAWEPAMAGQLRADGYDVAIPFDWAATSNLPIPGQAVAAGQRLASAIVQAAGTFPPNAVVDVHLIGDSRGAVVASEAMTDLLAAERSDPTALAGLQAGSTKLTLLDPHPAHNVHTVGRRGAAYYSAAPGLLGRLAVAVTRAFQAAAVDPEVVVPPGVADVEVYYQHTRASATASPLEHVLNLWGEVPVPGATHSGDLTGVARGHTEVRVWYQQHVVPNLWTNLPFVRP